MDPRSHALEASSAVPNPHSDRLLRAREESRCAGALNPGEAAARGSAASVCDSMGCSPWAGCCPHVDVDGDRERRWGKQDARCWEGSGGENPALPLKGPTGSPPHGRPTSDPAGLRSSTIGPVRVAGVEFRLLVNNQHKEETIDDGEKKRYKNSKDFLLTTSHSALLYQTLPLSQPA